MTDFVDPIANFLNFLWRVYTLLPSPFTAFMGVVAVFAVVLIIIRIVRGL